MKTQISRDSHQPERDYSGVYLQQGRLITDADWNELVDVVNRRLHRALDAVVGSGSPRNGGLDIVLATEAGEIAPEFDPRLETEEQFTAREAAFFADGRTVSVRLQPGVITVDGLHARLVPAQANGTAAHLIEFTAQRDFPGAPALPIDQLATIEALVLYADVWERTVTALEDDTLRDTALRGADTATRIQTMVQVKYSRLGNAPDNNPELLPAKGSAPLKLQLRTAREETEEAADRDQRIGNYLFRVEVHDVKGPANRPESITLKWSRENGAEAYLRVNAQGQEQSPPGDFESGDWVYESYTDVTERHLGVHLLDEGELTPRRGVLSTTNDRSRADLGIENSALRLYVRRWDGGCTLIREGDAWRLEEQSAIAIDRGVRLQTELNDQAHGQVRIDNGVLAVNMETLRLELALAGHSFVAGDYWNAAVRELGVQSGDYVLGNAERGEAPIGIEHHYQFLKEVRLANDRPRLVQPLEISRPLRRYPALTDLRSTDIISQPTDGGPDTVAGVLDRLDRLVSELRQLQQDLQDRQTQLRGDFDGLNSDVWRVQRDWLSNLTINPPPRGQVFPQTGFQRLPSGLVISWGVFANLRQVNSVARLDFPITHPRQPHVLVSSGTRDINLSISRVERNFCEVTESPQPAQSLTAGFIAIG